MIDMTQYAKVTVAFTKAMQEVGPEKAILILKDIVGIDPEVYEWDRNELVKAAEEKIAPMTHKEVDNLLARMALAGGKKPCQIVTALKIMETADRNEGVQE